MRSGEERPDRRLLEEVGLDKPALRDALADEFAQSLAVVGIRVADFDLPVSSARARTPRWGTSAKLAIKRMSTIAPLNEGGAGGTR